MHYILGDNEEEIYSGGNIRKLHYLYPTDGIFAIYVDNLIGNDSMYDVHKDYLGNMETVTSSTGTILEKLSFDPWGRRRNPDNWTYTASTYHSYFDRGYTMHCLSRPLWCVGKHLDVFGLINMNGRLYDPWVGRMLSPDPYIVEPSNSQNYNRYSYALNNPLKYIDPTGYRPHWYDYPGNEGSGRGGDISGAINRQMGTHGTNYVANYVYSEGLSSGGSYTYDWATDTYLNGQGNAVEYSEVFSNFVTSNSISLPSNTDLYSIKAKGDGYSFCTIDQVPSPMLSSFSKEVNLHFVLFDSNVGSLYQIDDVSNRNQNDKFPTITRTITEKFLSSRYVSAKTYTKSISKGNSNIAFNFNRKNQLESFSYYTLISSTTIGVNNNSILFGNGINFGTDNMNYIINVSLPIGNSSVGGASLYFDQRATNQFVLYSFMYARMAVPQLRLIPL